MEQRKQQLKAYEQNTLTKLDSLKAVIGKKKTVGEIISRESTEPSFAKIRKLTNAGLMKIVLLETINNLVEIVGADLNEKQVDYLIEYVSKNFYYYTVSDFNIVIEMMISQKTYGKPNIQSIISTLTEYDTTCRSVASEEDNIKRTAEINAIELTNNKIREEYSRIIKESKMPKVTQKEKDAENKRVNDEKIKQLLNDEKQKR